MTLRIAITAGEPAGVGPELLAAVLRQRWEAELVVIGNAKLIEQRSALSGERIALQGFDAALPAMAGRLSCLEIDLQSEVVAGQLNADNARHVHAMLSAAGEQACAGVFDAVVTAPVHKAVLNDGGFEFTGHTEFLARQARCDVLMLLATEGLRVALATTHLPLRQVPDAIDAALIERCVRLLDRALRDDFAVASPRIDVLGLNPHAGESGHLGREEIETIIPTLQRLRDQGFDLRGPLPADTAFVVPRIADTDAFLAMYHDQGLPVLKALGFGDAVNITLGLPYVRTSVDHGTALDLAGTGRASAASLIAATRSAIAMAQRRRSVRR